MVQHLFKLVSIIIFCIILNGCDGGFTTENIDKMISDISNNEKLSKYVVSIEAVETERGESGKEPYYWYDINGKLNDSFDQLSTKEQYTIFANIVELMQKNGGEISGDSEFYCGKEIDCYIGRVDLTTSNHSYGVEYYPNSTSDLFWADDEIVFDNSAADGIYIDPLADNNTEKSGDEEQTSLDAQTATGSDWVTLEYEEKFSLLSEALANMAEAGDLKVSADADWFINALDSYWDGSPTTESVIEIMAITGVAGGVIEEK
ncbi:hypothetical protein OEV98_03895 [Caldibacillus lycopersici]|uniref:Uncharacterized protein n=1 Tax=Perspicuibacillus lycopersici TaxID=1325689 RepID=A0AAE3IR77_9BACI|nr:hypothetical protein [Perspicuibacillus lycopersici]MCU9612707.1 hypothetical protein [Perspicuibacillus lycopersici]